VPNKGPKSIGYVPREDVVLSWPTFTDAAREAGASRLVGGIHIAAGNDEGLKLGEMVGEAVWKRYRGLIRQKMRNGMRKLHEKNVRKYNNAKGEMRLNQENGVRGTMTKRV
jgi:hypothetical protein